MTHPIQEQHSVLVHTAKVASLPEYSLRPEQPRSIGDTDDMGHWDGFSYTELLHALLKRPLQCIKASFLMKCK